MAYYSYKVKDLYGGKHSGKYLARDDYELIRTLRNEGYYVLSYKVIKRKMNRFNFKAVTSYELSIFCKEFATLISSGIDMSESLQILCEGNLNKKMKRSIMGIQERVQQGEELSASMKQFSDIYPEFMINMIMVGEQSGNLDYIFNKLYEYYSKDHRLKSNIKKAMIYPAVVFCITSIIMSMLILKVLPTFADTFVSLGAKLPALTINILKISTFLKENFATILCFFIITIVTVMCYKKTNKGEVFFHKAKLKLPLIGKINGKITTAMFSCSVSLLINSGISIIKSMDIVTQLTGNKYFETRLGQCTKNIRKGNTITIAIKEIDVFPPLMHSLVKVGEESGRLPEMLDKAANIFYEEVYETIEKLTQLIEPALIVLVSIIVGIIVAAVMLPMLTVMDKISF